MGLTRRIVPKLQIHQREVERNMLGIKVRDKEPNLWRQQITKLDNTVKNTVNVDLNTSTTEFDKWSSKIFSPWGENGVFG